MLANLLPELNDVMVTSLLIWAAMFFSFVFLYFKYRKEK